MMVVFELHNANKYSSGSGLAPETLISWNPAGQQKCLWIPRMGGFEMHTAKKLFWHWSGAPNTYRPAKVFVNTKDGDV